MRSPLRSKIFLFALPVLFWLASTSPVQAGFVPNQGQFVDVEGNPIPEVHFAAEVEGGKVFFKENGFSYVLLQEIEDGSLAGHRVDFDFAGAEAGVWIGEERLPGYMNYYLAHCPEGISQVPHFEALRFSSVYPGIDLVARIVEGRFKYDWVVYAGGNPNQIALEMTGQSAFSLSKDGEMSYETSVGTVTETIPEAWMEDENGVRSPVKMSWELDGHLLAFKDAPIPGAGQKLVIDPLSTWATYIGGNSFDYGRGLAYWGGFIHLTGETQSTNFPVSTGAFQVSKSGGRDAVAMKFTNTGLLVWATHYGGSSTDAGEAVDVDVNGNVAFAGRTRSGFPTSAGAHQTTGLGGDEAFLVKLNASGNRIFATYISGGSDEDALGVAVDNAQNIVVVGNTGSSSGIATAGSFQTSRSGNDDGFIVKFDPNGNRLWGSYLGGTSQDIPRDVDVDSGNNILVTGETYGNFPVGACCGNTAWQTSEGGGFGDKDIFITQIAPDGNLRNWSTYYGGGNIERGYGIAVDAADNVIVTGNCDGTGFPTTFGTVQPSWGGGGSWGNSDAVLVKFAQDGTRLWATYYGGGNYDQGMAVYAPGTNNIYMVGETASGWPAYGFDCGTICTATFCGFVVHLDGNGANRIMGTTVGGAGTFNSVLGVTADTDANIYITGFTSSTNFPVGGPNVFQSSYGGGSSDGFIGLVNADSCNAVVLEAGDLTLWGERESDNWRLEWSSEWSQDDQLWIERSLDGLHFAKLQELESHAGQLMTPVLAGGAYFRLGRLGRDGKLEHSETLHLSAESAAPFSLHRLSNQTLELRTSAEASWSLRMFDAGGRLIREFSTKSSSQTLSLEGLAGGLYFLDLVQGSQRQREKVFVH